MFDQQFATEIEYVYSQKIIYCKVYHHETWTLFKRSNEMTSARITTITPKETGSRQLIDNNTH